MRIIAVLFPAVFIFSGVTAQEPDSVFIARMASTILTEGKIYDNLRELTKTVGGRLSGSPQTAKAEAWGKKTLTGAGADKVYFQECRVPHWVRGNSWYTYAGPAGKKMKRRLDVLALGNSIGTGPAGVKAGVVYCNNFDELEQQKDKVKGKIVFFNYPFNEKFLQPFRAYGDAGIYRRSGPSRAAKYGAVAVLIRSLSGSTDNNPHTGVMQYDSGIAQIPCAAMGLRDADTLAALMKAGKPVEIYYQSNAHFLPDTIAHNVIGELTGSEFPNEIITVGGHLDSWDPAEGAQDDGAGCVHAIEVLRVMKELGYTPRHTIRAVLFANEENGDRGGESYADAAAKSTLQHIFALESDAGGFTPRGFGFTMSAGQLQKVQAWVPLFVPYGVYQFTAPGGGSDVGPLHKALNTPVAGLLPDGNRYFDLHHSRGDVLENVNKRELELGAVNMAALIYMVDKYGL
jgi:carboxypeptidase Q